MPARFCCDCAYFVPGDHSDPHRFATCQNAANATINPVSGARELAYCSPARNFGPCGPDAKFFEQAIHITGDDTPTSAVVSA